MKVGAYILRRLNPVLLFICTLLISGCNESPKKISTELINIPATASTLDSTDSNSDLDTEKLGANIQFEHEEFNFKTVVAGRRITHVFTFINSGDSPLLLSDINAPCGCTVAKEWPKEAIPPGKGGAILVEFDSSDRTGHQEKVIHVVTNSRPSTLQLLMTGDVIGPDYTLEDL